jgi:hypothetical protein
MSKTPDTKTRLRTLVVRLRVMVHDDNLWDLGDLDHEIDALGIELPELGPCASLQRLAELMQLPHYPEGYTIVTIEKALQDKVSRL